jgi:hypothetical protein
MSVEEHGVVGVVLVEPVSPVERGSGLVVHHTLLDALEALSVLALSVLHLDLIHHSLFDVLGPLVVGLLVVGLLSSGALDLLPCRILLRLLLRLSILLLGLLGSRGFDSLFLGTLGDAATATLSSTARDGALERAPAVSASKISNVLLVVEIILSILDGGLLAVASSSCVPCCEALNSVRIWPDNMSNMLGQCKHIRSSFEVLLRRQLFRLKSAGRRIHQTQLPARCSRFVYLCQSIDLIGLILQWPQVRGNVNVCTTGHSILEILIVHRLSEKQSPPEATVEIHAQKLRCELSS